MQKFLRIIAGIAGGLAIVFGLGQIFGSGAIRNCDDGDVLSTVRGLAIQIAPPGLTGNGDPNSEAWKSALAALNVTDVTETSWDKDAEVRLCTANFSLKIGMVEIYKTTKMDYSISRSKTDTNTLDVFLQRAP
jgi:hypothetical protein